MHPLLADWRRLTAYLLVWAPLAALLVWVVAGGGHFPGGGTALVIVPACFLYAFACLSAWYSCRLLPVERAGIGRVLAAHGVGSWFLGSIWTAVTLAFARFATGRLGWPAGERERFTTHAMPVLVAAGVLLYLLWTAFYYGVQAIEARGEAERREREARALAGEAELRALKAQVNPHFLFNSLNSISALTSIDPAGAREMCVLLSEFMRKTLGLGLRDRVTLGEELALARSFLAVEKVRFGARLEVEEQIEDAAQSCMLPPLLLQPLIENAIKHGVSKMTEGGYVRLEAQRAAGRLSILVENAFDSEAVSRGKGGVGLANVRRRLELRYGGQAALQISSEDSRYRVRVLVPVETEP